MTDTGTAMSRRFRVLPSFEGPITTVGTLVGSGNHISDPFINKSGIEETSVGGGARGWRPARADSEFGSALAASETAALLLEGEVVGNAVALGLLFDLDALGELALTRLGERLEAALVLAAAGFAFAADARLFASARGLELIRDVQRRFS